MEQGSTTGAISTLDSAASRAPVRALDAVTIVVPCFNEVDSLDRLSEGLHDLQAELETQRACYFILIDDGSSDGTAEGLERLFASRPNFRIIRHDRNRGISAAIRTGIEAASTEIVCSIDSDCSYDPIQIEGMLPQLTERVDMVTASPYHPDGLVKNVPMWRLRISQVASRAYRLLLKADLHTYTSCFRVYRRSTFMELGFTEDGFVGVAEVVWRLDQIGAEIVEYPATLDIRRFGQSKMRVAHVALDHGTLMCRILAWRLGVLTRIGRQPKRLAANTTAVL